MRLSVLRVNQNGKTVEVIFGHDSAEASALLVE